MDFVSCTPVTSLIRWYSDILLRLRFSCGPTDSLSDPFYILQPTKRNEVMSTACYMYVYMYIRWKPAQKPHASKQKVPHPKPIQIPHGEERNPKNATSPGLSTLCTFAFPPSLARCSRWFALAHSHPLPNPSTSPSITTQISMKEKT